MTPPVGPERDRAVAEMLGWKLEGTEDHRRPKHTTRAIKVAGQPSRTEPYDDWDSKGPHPRLVSSDRRTVVWLCGCDKDDSQIPEYSTSPAAAFEALEMWVGQREEHEDRGYGIHRLGPGTYVVSVWRSNMTRWFGEAPTFPDAATQALLRAGGAHG